MSSDEAGSGGRVARLFVALPLPRRVARQLERLAPGASGGVRPVTPTDLHITLHFLGRAEVESVQRALEEVTGSAFEIRLGRLGHFSLKGGRRVLWAGVRDNEPLTALHATVAAVLAPLGFVAEQRAYRPHVTLARVAGAVPGSLIEAFERGRVPAAAARFRCVRFALFSSRSGTAEPRYTELGSYPLAAG